MFPLVDLALLWEEMLYMTASFAGLVAIEHFVSRAHLRYATECELEAHREKLKMEHELWATQQHIVGTAEEDKRQEDRDFAMALARFEHDLEYDDE